MTTELLKMRHLRLPLLLLVLTLGVVGVSLLSALSSPDFDPDSPAAWDLLLGGAPTAWALIAPLLLAVMASRQVEMEHRSGGWLLSATHGVPPGRVCRNKVLALGIPVAGATITASLLLIAAGLALGITADVPALRWAGFTASVVVVNLVILAVHIALSARVDNQLIALGVALLGTVVALFAGAFPTPVPHLTPWGYYSLAAAADYQGDQLTAVTPDYFGVAVLAVIAAAGFLLLTRRFNRPGVIT